MNPITYQEAFQVLHKAGFVETEIDRLYRLRRDYQKSELDQPSLDTNRLLFARWLVTTGRLTEQLSEETQPAPSITGWTLLKSLLVHLL